MTKDPYASLKQGLVGAWIPSLGASGFRLIDRSQYGNHGTLTNMDAGTDWVASRYGWALDFDGSNDYTTQTVAKQLTQSFTFSTFIRLQRIGSTNVESFFNVQATSYANYWINASTYLGNWEFALFDGSNNPRVASSSITTNVWYHFCGVRDVGSDLLLLYLNGFLAGTLNDNTTSTPPHSQLTLGGQLTPANRYAACTLDDSRLYERALTASEIRLLASERGIGFKPNSRTSSHFAKRYSYKPPKEKNYSVIVKSQTDYDSLRQGLVGAWCPSVSGPSGYRAIDLSGYGNHGTLTNMDAATDWVVSGGAGALDFDGTDDYADYNTQISLSGSTTVSFSAWVWRATQGAVFALARYNTSLGAQLRGDLFGTNNYTTNGRINLSISGVTGTDYLDFYSTEQIVAQQWNHIAATCLIAGNSSVCNLYLNGKAATVNSSHSGTRPTSWSTNNAVPYTSMRVIISSGNPLYSSGIIDDLRAYNRLLTPSEIRLLASKRGIGLQPRPRHYTYTQLPSGAKRRRILTGMP